MKTQQYDSTGGCWIDINEKRGLCGRNGAKYEHKGSHDHPQTSPMRALLVKSCSRHVQGYLISTFLCHSVDLVCHLSHVSAACGGCLVRIISWCSKCGESSSGLKAVFTRQLGTETCLKTFWRNAWDDASARPAWEEGGGVLTLWCFERSIPLQDPEIMKLARILLMTKAIESRTCKMPKHFFFTASFLYWQPPLYQATTTIDMETKKETSPSDTFVKSVHFLIWCLDTSNKSVAECY